MKLKCLFSVTLIACIFVWTALRLHESATEFSEKILFSEGTFTDWWLLLCSSLFCLSWPLHFKWSCAGFNGQNLSAILVFSFLLEFFNGSLQDNRPTRIHSAWVFVIFGCGHTCLGESPATALVEVKFNSLTLAALSFNTAKDLLVFSISPLSRSREIEFSLNIAYTGVLLRATQIVLALPTKTYNMAVIATIIANFICFFTLTREMLRLQFLSNYLSNFFPS